MKKTWITFHCSSHYQLKSPIFPSYDCNHLAGAITDLDSTARQLGIPAVLVDPRSKGKQYPFVSHSRVYAALPHRPPKRQPTGLGAGEKCIHRALRGAPAKGRETTTVTIFCLGMLEVHHNSYSPVLPEEDDNVSLGTKKGLWKENIINRKKVY